MIDCLDYYYDKCHALTYMCKDCPERKKMKMVEKITDADLLKDILWEDNHDYTIIETKQVGNSRWHDIIETVFRRESDDKLFIMDWRRGATECQENEYPELAVEAEEFIETMTSYRPVKERK